MVLSIVLTLTACSGGGGDGVPPVTGGDRIVSIDSGGYISIPENALPDSAQVSVAPTRTPILPDDVMPVGEALAISATEDLLEPATLHLPIPAGVVDPANLVIVRVEPNGRTTFLMTSVEGNELVAATPGFSTFSVVNALDSTKWYVSGKKLLIAGERASYSFLVGLSLEEIEPVLMVGSAWTLGPHLTVINKSD